MNLPPHQIVEAISAQELKNRVDELVEEIHAKCLPGHTGENPEKTVVSNNLVIVGVLRGSFMFLADLVRSLNRHRLHPRIDFMTLSSYGGGTQSSGNVRILKDVSVDLEGADVLLVDDILDSGRTLRFAVRHIENKGARRVMTCCLLDKPARRAVDIQADFRGFEIPDVFVVGYGLDYDSHYRELPYIGNVIHEKAATTSGS
ncbi:MAG: hypoxanthine phosphoribosyltransferase [Verrucomicrobia bacterium]|nr:hypoxanthine phosphoribosyltransferase [Verrucomicrobiota bacterium]MCH8510029.1 hypoxanthine phosphoribosyltransferase [Kiritimatiellia bacterium]